MYFLFKTLYSDDNKELISAKIIPNPNLASAWYIKANPSNTTPLTKNSIQCSFLFGKKTGSKSAVNKVPVPKHAKVIDADEV